MMPIEAKFQSYVAFVARSRLQIPSNTAVSFSPRQSTTKVALLKATKHKSNPAAGEVRVDNRTYGLA